MAGSYLCSCLLLKRALFQLGSASWRPTEVNNINLEAFWRLSAYKCSLKFKKSKCFEYNGSTVCSQLETSGAVQSHLMRAVSGGGEVSVCLILS